MDSARAMAHDVFISYASQNKSAADAVCSALEAARIRCWIAPRDVPPGKTWPAAILQAIKESRGMVLIFTADSNSSKEVLKEVTLAGKYEKAILPFRIEAVEPSDDMEYHLSTPHWLDALTPPLEAHIARLVAGVAGIVGRREEPATEPPRSASLPRSPQPGDVKVNPVDGQRYVWIPPGEFDMGASPGDDEASDDEKPRHRVTISRGFWMGETPVTVDAYRRFAEATGRAMPEEPAHLGKALNPGWRFGQVPMTMVTWDDAVAYARWAGMRLPTEAEWEYAARAGTTGPRYGDLDRIAWTADNSGDRGIDSAKIRAGSKDWTERWKRILGHDCRPRDVSGKQPNPWGLYDMLGNVWEWTADWYDEKYYEISPTKDPQGAASGKYRSARGGSWNGYPSDARASYRGWSDATNQVNYFGFRCTGE